MKLITQNTTKEQVLEEYKNYPSTLSEIEPYHESRLAPILYEIPKGSMVLDVGCNDGTFMQLLKEKRSCNVFGVDVSETALEEAKKKGLSVQYADAEKLPFSDGTFDVVVCMEVLSHLFDPAGAVREMRRVLKKNGVLLGSTPHLNLERYAWEDKRMHRRYFDEDGLCQILKEGFSRTWLKVLNGAQFAMSLAGSFLGDQPCEMLFKSGNTDTLGWDAALQDRSTLRCWFGFTQTPGTVYYRMSGFADKMQKMGAETHYNPYDELDRDGCSEWSQKVKWIHSERRYVNQHIIDTLFNLMKAADMSIFQVTFSRDVLAYLTAFRDPLDKYPNHPKKPLLIEMDDWFFDLPSYNIASGPYHPNSEPESVAYDQIKLADAIICSTQYLKEKIAQLFPEKPAYVIKNTLDFDIWDNVERPTKCHDEKSDLVRIVYTGCGNHSGDLEIVKKPILALLDEFPNLEFVTLPFKCFEDVTHPRFFQLDVWVGLSQFPKLVAAWEPDIGIAPLRDNEFNRVKSNLRWLEYSALKVPTVASRVYPFEKSISNNKDGLVVGNSAKEWYDALKALIVDKGRRAALGEAAYKRVKKDFNMEDGARAYLSVLKKIKDEFIRHSSGVRSSSRRLK